MSEIEEKMQEFADQGAFSAYSGAQKVREFIGAGKEHLISRYYDWVCDCGDAEKARGIREMVVDVFERKEWLENDAPVIYAEANAKLNESLDGEGNKRVSFNLNLEEGT